MMVVVAVQTSRRRAATDLPGAVHTEAAIMARKRSFVAIHHDRRLPEEPYLEK